MSTLSASRIRHSVAFTLKHAAGSAEEQAFLDSLAALSAIEGVEEFEILREVSPKNGYAFAVWMEFADQDAYTAYNGHPDHVAFVEGTWVPEVVDFLEIDTQALDRR